MTKTYVQNKETGKFVLKSEYHPEPANVHSVHTIRDPFLSPIDQTLISDTGQLRAHNRKHGVADRRDYGEQYFDTRRNELETTRQSLDKGSKADRIEALKQATENHNRT